MIKPAGIKSVSDLELGEVPDWPLIYQVAILSVLFLTVQLVSGWVYLYPKHQDINRLSAESDRLLYTIQGEEHHLSSQKSTNVRLLQLKEEIKQQAGHFNGAGAPKELLLRVNEAGAKELLTFRQIKWTGESTLSIELTGGYSNIYQFALYLSGLSEIVIFEYFVLQRSGPGSMKLHLKAGLRLHRELNEQSHEELPGAKTE